MLLNKHKQLTIGDFLLLNQEEQEAFVCNCIYYRKLHTIIINEYALRKNLIKNIISALKSHMAYDSLNPIKMGDSSAVVYFYPQKSKIDIYGNLIAWISYYAYMLTKARKRDSWVRGFLEEKIKSIPHWVSTIKYPDKKLVCQNKNKFSIILIKKISEKQGFSYVVLKNTGKNTFRVHDVDMNKEGLTQKTIEKFDKQIIKHEGQLDEMMELGFVINDFSRVTNYSDELINGMSNNLNENI